MIVHNFLGTDKHLFAIDALDEPAFQRTKRRCHVRLNSPFAARFISRLRQYIGPAATRMNITIGPIVECFMTRYGDGDYLGSHRDGIHGRMPHRVLSWAYYQRLGTFTGGALTFQDNDEYVAADDDTLVIFDSHRPHAVEEVRAKGTAWGDARFAFSGWVGDPSFDPPSVLHHIDGAEAIEQWGPTYIYTPLRNYARKSYGKAIQPFLKPPIYEADAPINMNKM